MQAKKIVPLRFDTWAPFTVRRGEFTQPLFGFAELRLDPSRQAAIRDRSKAPACPCCSTALSEQERIGAQEDEDAGTRTLYESCPACGFWRFRLADNVSEGYYTVPSIREFIAKDETPALTYLAAEAKANPAMLYGLEPYTFERFVGSVLREFFACDVHHVGRAGDDGVDLLAVVKDEPILIQVKRRASPNAVEGVDVVKLLFASAFGRRARRGAVITTATRFSKHAQRWKTLPALTEIGFQLDLVDFNSLMSMVNAVAPSGECPPWLAHRNRPGRAGKEVSWNLHQFEEHDCLSQYDGGQGRVLLFHHRTFEDCVVLTGPELILRAFVENGRPELPLASRAVAVSIRRNDWDLEGEMGVTIETAERLTSRWIQLYPDRVVDATP
jgi:hypothetical protein